MRRDNKNSWYKNNICMFDYAVTKLIFIGVILWNWFTQDFFKQDSKIIVQMHCLWIGWQQVGSCVGFTLPKLSFEITTRTQTQIQRLFGWQNTIHSHIRRIWVFLPKLEPATKTRKINYLPEFIGIFPFHDKIPTFKIFLQQKNCKILNKIQTLYKT
jgi:hypothetical protein